MNVKGNKIELNGKGKNGLKSNINKFANSKRETESSYIHEIK